MAGTTQGGKKGSQKILARDPNFFRRIGASGGRKGAKDGAIKGFAANPGLASRSGKIGGKKSRRGKARV